MFDALWLPALIFTVLCGPIAYRYYLLYFRYFYFHQPIFQKFGIPVMGLVLVPMLLVILSGYAGLANVWIGTQEQFHLSGIVIEKFMNDSNTPLITVRMDDGRTRRIKIQKVDWNKIEIGQVFGETWMRGSLGFVYRDREWN